MSRIARLLKLALESGTAPDPDPPPAALRSRFEIFHTDDLDCGGSSVIESFAYRERDRTLRVLFVGLRVYEYTGVGKDVADKFRGVPSAGVYFNGTIKGRYSCRSIEYDSEFWR